MGVDEETVIYMGNQQTRQKSHISDLEGKDFPIALK